MAELLEVAPGSLHLGDNPRKKPVLDDLVESVRELGVLLPVRATRSPLGHLVVHDGQRRVLAAIEAGLDSIPVYLYAEDDPAAAAADSTRLLEQLACNTARADLSLPDQIAACRQLAFFGVSPEQIAKATGGHKSRIKEIYAAARSTVAAAVVEAKPEVGLDQLALVAQAQEDGKIDDTEAADLVRDLDTSRNVSFQISDRLHEIARTKLIDSEVQHLKDQGFAAVPTYDMGDCEGWMTLARLKIDKEEHLDCEGHMLVVGTRFVPATSEYELSVVPYCTDPVAFGHVPDPALVEAEEARRAADEERAAAAWAVACQTRREFIISVLERPSVANDSVWVARRIADQSYVISRDAECEIIASLGVDCTPAHPTSAYREWCAAAADWAGDHVTRARKAAFAMALAYFEGMAAYKQAHPLTVPFLHALEEWGYQLTEPELALIEHLESKDKNHA